MLEFDRLGSAVEASRHGVIHSRLKSGLDFDLLDHALRNTRCFDEVGDEGELSLVVLFHEEEVFFRESFGQPIRDFFLVDHKKIHEVCEKFGVVAKFLRSDHSQKRDVFAGVEACVGDVPVIA